MPWHRRLRWRLIGVQIFAVSLGAVSMFLIWSLFIPVRLNQIVQGLLTPLALSAEQMTAVEEALSISLNQLVLSSIGAAAIIAIFAGIISSLVLWRIIIRPLRGMVSSSQRISNGRYDERVPIPEHAGEAMAQLAQNFNQMAHNLESVEQQRVELLGNVTHELRTPLTSLNGYVEGLADGVFQPNERVLNSMGLQIGRLKRLVDDIQLLSRVEAGAIQLVMEPMNLNDVVNQVVFQLQPKQLAKQIDIDLIEMADDVYVLGDYDRLTQILVNLLSNGIQYTPENGRISIEIRTDGNRSFVDVRDNGAGIPAESLPFLFERFYRVDPSRSRELGGSGVGLTISRHLAWAMGGELTATSAGIGKGSCFTLEMPLVSLD